MAKIINTLIIIFVLAVLGATGSIIWKAETKLPPIQYSQFLQVLEEDKVKTVHLKGGEIAMTNIYGQQFSTFSPDVASLMPHLLKKEVSITAESDSPSPFWNFLTIFAPVILIVIAWFFLMKKQQTHDDEGDNSKFAREKMIDFAMIGTKVTFEDVAGIPEAKQELLEIIDFLKDPKRFSKLGANIPKGVLLQGPPGTGKTLLAKAIAGEAGVPFFSFSGSDFVEMFVGVGASRVRDLFREAKKKTPCIVFIDEIDAVGGHRGAGGTASGQDERGQTLNALLVEMDGFSGDDTIIVLAATNRPDILDPALRRPGRFDRLITILPPDVKGRLQILKVHCKKVAVADSVDLTEIAQSTPGFSGAELANLVNEAALIAARSNKDAIESSDFESAKDRILMGAERKGLVISENDRKTMAYHEAGHAILTKFLPEADPLHKITIIPRGKAMGHTQQLPLKDRHAYSKEYLRNRIIILMGGRAAEEIALDQQTTGAEDDLLRATEIARKMVCKWGMNHVVGPLAYSKDENGFLGEIPGQKEYSDTFSRHIDQEVKKLIEDCYHTAADILTREKDFLYHLAEILLQTETLDSEEIEIIYECSARKSQAGKGGAEDSEHTAADCMVCPASTHCSHLKTA